MTPAEERALCRSARRLARELDESARHAERDGESVAAEGLRHDAALVRELACRCVAQARALARLGARLEAKERTLKVRNDALDILATKAVWLRQMLLRPRPQPN